MSKKTTADITLLGKYVSTDVAIFLYLGEVPIKRNGRELRELGVMCQKENLDGLNIEHVTGNADSVENLLRNFLPLEPELSSLLFLLRGKREAREYFSLVIYTPSQSESEENNNGFSEIIDRRCARPRYARVIPLNPPSA